MIVAVASGKGGTGKTTIATGLAVVAASRLREAGGEAATVTLLDCDVEEPNAHLYLDPRLDSREVVGVPTPIVDEVKCDLCRRCAEVCVYHALAVLGARGDGLP